MSEKNGFLYQKCEGFLVKEWVFFIQFEYKFSVLVLTIWHF